MQRFQGAMREQGLLMPYDLTEWLGEILTFKLQKDIYGQFTCC